MTPAQAAEEAAIMIDLGFKPVPQNEILEVSTEYYFLLHGKPVRLAGGGDCQAGRFGYPIFVKDELRQPSTTLPTEPGLYWWRAQGGDKWIAVSAWRFNNHVVYEMVTDHIFLGDALTKAVWEAERGIGQWLPCLPPSLESEVKG